MHEALETLPRLRRPAAVNAAEYWIAPERFTRRCGRLGDRFVVPMPATGPWLCLTDPDDIKGVFTADTNVLRFGAALVKTAPHQLLLGPTGLTTADGPEHMRKRRMQLPAFQRKVVAGYEEVMQRKTEETLAGLVFDRPARAHDFTQEIIIAAVFGMTEPARVKRLRTATLALMREASSRRFLLQTIIATSVGMAGTDRSRGFAAQWRQSTRLSSKRPASVSAPASSSGTTCSGCSCAPLTITAARCLTTSSATRCGRC